MERERPDLHPIPIKSPWFHIGMDFIGPISPTSEKGNHFILTISDYFTKYAWAKALPTKEAVGVVDAMREVRLKVPLSSLCRQYCDIIVTIHFCSCSLCLAFRQLLPPIKAANFAMK